MEPVSGVPLVPLLPLELLEPLVPEEPASDVSAGVGVASSEHPNAAAVARARPDEINPIRMLMFIAPAYPIG